MTFIHNLILDEMMRHFDEHMPIGMDRGVAKEEFRKALECIEGIDCHVVLR